MVLVDSHGLSRIPCYSGTPPGDRVSFVYGAVTLCGAPFQSASTTDRRAPWKVCRPFQWVPRPRCSIAGRLCHYSGLGSSLFARRYSGSHGCFLFLGVLRWFTSPGSLVHPMDSDARNECSHSLGFPIRKSPDHSLLAASRGLSQLTASFFAFLRLGIHTHALSSLTITSTSHTHERYFFGCLLVRQPSPIGAGSPY